jgi:hypothetical protein
VRQESRNDNCLCSVQSGLKAICGTSRRVAIGGDQLRHPWANRHAANHIRVLGADAAKLVPDQEMAWRVPGCAWPRRNLPRYRPTSGPVALPFAVVLRETFCPDAASGAARPLPQGGHIGVPGLPSASAASRRRCRRRC